MSAEHVGRIRVGFFGLLGQGNLGNDGSLAVMLSFVESRHPQAVIDFLCSGPLEITRRYGYPATRLHWNSHEDETASSAAALSAKALGKLADVYRLWSWVRQHDVVIVPGMGVMESTLPLRPWGFPYSLMLACAAGRLSGARVALVNVGASPTTSRATRWLVRQAASHAYYRSFRDELSRDAISAMGVDTAQDPVYPDLVFAMSVALPPEATAEEPIVGLGVMEYSGDNDDRAVADEVHARYVAKIVQFALWLVDQGLKVRVFGGDRSDEQVALTVENEVRRQRPDADGQAINTEPATTLADLLQQISQLDVVVATRFHNIVAAVKLAKPTISLGYAQKNDVLMASMGLGDYCQSVRSFDVDELIEQFVRLRDQRDELVASIRQQAAANAARLEEQFAAFSRDVMAPARRRRRRGVAHYVAVRVLRRNCRPNDRVGDEHTSAAHRR